MPSSAMVNFENFLPTKALVRISATMSSVPVWISLISPLAISSNIIFSGSSVGLGGVSSDSTARGLADLGPSIVFDRPAWCAFDASDVERDASDWKALSVGGLSLR